MRQMKNRSGLSLSVMEARCNDMCLASTTFPGQRQLFFPIDDNYQLYFRRPDLLRCLLTGQKVRLCRDAT
jgi:hypothetical protein